MGQFIFPLVGLGKLAPDAALERGDVEVGRWIDDSACARDRLLDDELAALEAAVYDRGERRLDAFALRGGEHLDEHDGVFERDRGAGGERRRRAVYRVADQRRAPAMPRRRDEDRLDRPA